MREPRIFISSLIERLRQQRSWVEAVIRELPFQPPPQALMWEGRNLGLDGPVLSHACPRKACLASVDKSDIVIGLLGRDYGTPQESGLSATHEELRHAIAKGKSALIFKDTTTRFETKQMQCINELGRWTTGRCLIDVSFRKETEFKREVAKHLAPVVESAIHEGLREIILSEAEARVLFEREPARASSGCCAFLAGDWSILGTKRGLLLPLDARIRVSARCSSVNTVHVLAYERSEDRWVLNETYSNRMSAIMGQTLEMRGVRKRFPWCPRTGIQCSVYSDLPYGSAAHEDAGFCLAAGAALEMTSNLTPKNALAMGGAILSNWYPQISWATLVRCHEPDPVGQHLLYFDRTKDGRIDLRGLAEKVGHPDFERNAFLSPKAYSTTRFNFGLNRISLWMGAPTVIDIDETLSMYREPLKSLDWRMMERIVSLMMESAVSGSQREIGLLMQMHQLALARARFVEEDFQQLLSWVNSLPGVLGAKAACARGRGSIVLLTTKPLETTSNVVLELQNRGLRPVFLQNRRPRGTVYGSGWN